MIYCQILLLLKAHWQDKAIASESEVWAQIRRRITLHRAAVSSNIEKQRRIEWLRELLVNLNEVFRRSQPAQKSKNPSGAAIHSRQISIA